MSWENAVLHHYATSYSSSAGPEFPEPYWSQEEPVPCPVCNRTTWCSCYPDGWGREEADYLADWHARIDAGEFDQVAME